MIGVAEQIALALMIVVIMIGMGATIRGSHFKNVVQNPKPVLIGLICQFGLMPAIAFALATVFSLSPAVALSLVMVGATPGGTTSNLFTYFARGNVALSVSMTVCSTLAAIVLMPLAIVLYGGQYTTESLEIPLSNIVVTLVLVLIPVAIGMWVLAKSEHAGRKLELTGSVVGIALIALLIGKFLVENGELFLSSSINLISAAILLGLVGFFLGYLLARAAGQRHADTRTISLETGIQNTPLTIAVISLSFSPGAIQDEMLLLPTFYAFFIVVTSLLVSFGFRKLA